MPGYQNFINPDNTQSIGDGSLAVTCVHKLTAIRS
jgi:hypothetical protein